MSLPVGTEGKRINLIFCERERERGRERGREREGERERERGPGSSSLRGVKSVKIIEKIILHRLLHQ